jgi:hypothetical protein
MTRNGKNRAQRTDVKYTNGEICNPMPVWQSQNVLQLLLDTEPLIQTYPINMAPKQAVFNKSSVELQSIQGDGYTVIKNNPYY